MAQDWQVESPKGRCATTGRPLEEGEAFYTVLFEDGESFRRADYCCEAWAGPPDGAFCCFRTRVPVKEKRKKLLVDDELLVNFFVRLGAETQPVRIHFRFVLALILMRKRLLRYEGSSREGAEETWTMTLASDRSSHRVVNPRLMDEQIDAVSRQLSAILHGDMGEWVKETAQPEVSETTEGSDDGPIADESA